MLADPLSILKTVFGYDSFRGRQRDVIDHVTAGHHAFVLMPTGGGKSLCYQIPALARPGIGLVISPLIALMEDQVAALRQAGVKAAALNSRLWGAEKELLWEDVERSELDLLYMAPETLLKPENLNRLTSARLSLIAIDEATAFRNGAMISGPNTAPSAVFRISSLTCRASRSPQRRMPRRGRKSSSI